MCFFYIHNLIYKDITCIKKKHIESNYKNLSKHNKIVCFCIIFEYNCFLSTTDKKIITIKIKLDRIMDQTYLKYGKVTYEMM